MNEPIRTPRSFATLSLPLADMRAVGKALSGTLNTIHNLAYYLGIMERVRKSLAADERS